MSKCSRYVPGCWIHFGLTPMRFAIATNSTDVSAIMCDMNIRPNGHLMSSTYTATRQPSLFSPGMPSGVSGTLAPFLSCHARMT